MISHCLFICSFISTLVCLLPNFCTQYFENERANFDTNWHKWSTGQEHETINFRSQKVKDRGHTHEAGEDA